MKGLILTYVMAYGGALIALVQPLVGVIVYAVFSTVRPQVIFAFAGDLSGVSLVVGSATLVGWALKGFGNWKLKSARWPVLLLIGFFAWTCLSAVFASDADIAFNYVIQRSKIVALFIVAITLIDSEIWVRR